MATNEIVHPLPLREQVADIVRIMILKGELKADQPISERYISNMLNVSTTPVKEAFRILQAEGLIYSIPRKGSYVSQSSIANMKQITFIRSSMEGVAAYYAAINITDEEIAELGRLMEEAGKLVHKPEMRDEFSRVNSEFHQIIRNASRNLYLTNMLSSLRSIDNSVRSVNLNLQSLDPALDHSEHLAIYSALVHHDPNLAEQSIIRHIRRVAHTVFDRENPKAGTA